ncbi:MAG: hypothetical protein KGO49_13675 [Gammaproteobacteria bacterium]|nr:hypothetical protein [Gammaproteobacteria bacterium]
MTKMDLVLLSMVVTFATLLSGCAPNPAKWDPAHPPKHQETVVAQICLPNDVVTFKDVVVDLRQEPPFIGYHNYVDGPLPPDNRTMDTVQQWMQGAGSNALSNFVGHGEVMKMSWGSGVAYLLGNTITNQPVFEERGRGGADQQQYLAESVTQIVEKDGQKERLEYWFTLPQKIPRGMFSAWQEPISEEDDQTRAQEQSLHHNATAWRLLHGEEMIVYPVGHNAPKMRFAIVSDLHPDPVHAHDESFEYWQRTIRAISKQVYGLPNHPITNFVEKRSMVIPSC